MPNKNSLEEIIRDSQHLLSFHQSLAIDAYPLTDGLKELLIRSSAKVRSRPHIRQALLPRDKPKKSLTPDEPAAPPETLKDIQQQLGDCIRCDLHKDRSSIIFGTGPAGARLIIIGEWPSVEDDRNGEIFSGQDGEMLNKMLRYVLEMEREEVYIASLVKCLAGDNNPDRQQINTCLPFLLAQIRAIHPAVIWTMGSTVAQTLLQTNKPLIRLRGHFHNVKGIPLMPTFHPSYLAKNPEMKKAVFQDLKMIAEKLAG